MQPGDHHDHGATLHNEEDAENDADDGNDSFKNLIGLAGEMMREDIDADVAVFLNAVTGAKPDLPDKDVAGKFFRPGQGIVENIAADDLHEKQGHYQKIRVDQDRFLKLIPALFQHLHVLLLSG